MDPVEVVKRATPRPRRALSGKVGLVRPPGNEGVPQEGGAARQAMAGVPVTARQVAKRSWRVSR